MLIDVRGPEEFDGPLGHIGGARNIAISELPARVYSLEEIKSALLVTMCKTDRRSAKAAKFLKNAGFQVQVLRRGMEAWNREGFAVERNSHLGLT